MVCAGARIGLPGALPVGLFHVVYSLIPSYIHTVGQLRHWSGYRLEFPGCPCWLCKSQTLKEQVGC
jgi:hypothetical protein